MARRMPEPALVHVIDDDNSAQAYLDHLTDRTATCLVLDHHLPLRLATVVRDMRGTGDAIA
jgi:hypothetical protein